MYGRRSALAYCVSAKMLSLKTMILSPRACATHRQVMSGRGDMRRRHWEAEYRR